MVRTTKFTHDGTQERLALSEHGRGSPAGLPNRRSLADQLIAERRAEERARSRPQPFGTPFPSSETAPGESFIPSAG
jgi:hypothetical protein